MGVFFFFFFFFFFFHMLKFWFLINLFVLICGFWKRFSKFSNLLVKKFQICDLEQHSHLAPNIVYICVLVFSVL